MKSLLAAALLLAQTTAQTPATAPYLETLEIRLHNLDVIVTDRDGKPVTNLTRDDFEILQEDVPQPITNFANASAAAGTTPNASDAADVRADPRRVVVYIDDVGLHPRTRGDFERTVLDLMDKTLRPEDEAMIFRPDEAHKVALGFTKDRDALHTALRAALQESRRRFDSPVANEQRLNAIRLEHMQGQQARRLAARQNAADTRRRVEQRLGSLRTIVTSMSEMPGRKMLILVSESMPAEPGKELFSIAVEPSVGTAFMDVPAAYTDNDWVSLKPVIDEIARTAGESGITIYTLQPELGVSAMAPGDVGTRDGPAPRSNLGPMLALVNTETTLSTLAEKTGGKFYKGDRVAEAVAQVASDIDSYYSLAFRASDAVDRARKVEVRVKNRPELRVRTRSEVLRKSPRREMTDRVVASLLVPRDVNELGITATAAKPQRVKGERDVYTVEVTVEVPLARLTFLPAGDRYRGAFTVHYAATGDDVDFMSGVQKEQVLEVPVADFEGVKAKSWRYKTNLQMRKGNLRVGVGVLDSTSHESGFQTLELRAE
jgi:VWFA-related protein